MGREREGFNRDGQVRFRTHVAQKREALRGERFGPLHIGLRKCHPCQIVQRNGDTPGVPALAVQGQAPLMKISRRVIFAARPRQVPQPIQTRRDPLGVSNADEEIEALLEQPLRQVLVPVIMSESAKVQQGEPGPPLVTQFPEHTETPLKMGSGREAVAPVSLGEAKIVERYRRASSISSSPPQLKCFAMELNGGIVASLVARQSPGAVERLGTGHVLTVYFQLQRRAEPALPVDEVASDGPESGQRSGEAQCNRGLFSIQRPA